jgi:group I intron endonuclease
MTTGIIYCLHCVSTGKKYIGQTKASLERRLIGHRHKAKESGVDSKSKLYAQISKTGWNDFICGIIEEFPLKDLDEKEIYYIEKYNTYQDGLNTAPGGGFFPSSSGHNHPLYGIGHKKETKEKISKNHHDVSGENNPMFGKKLSEEQKQKIREKSLINNTSKGTYWWNNGCIQIRSKEKPGDNFIRGRLNYSGANNPFYGRNHTVETKKKMSKNHHSKRK